MLNLPPKEWLIPLCVAVCLSTTSAESGHEARDATAEVLPAEAHTLEPGQPYILVLGVTQDGGYPHAGCRKDCCAPAWRDPSLSQPVACLGIVDPEDGGRWLIDATPDLPRQLHALNEQLEPASTSGGVQILLTHAHIGHYTGLMHLGREVMGTDRVPVYALPRMRDFLTTNGPWGQLVSLRNIELRTIQADQPVKLNGRLTATAMLVPHRDEYSETVGFKIAGPKHSVLFIPDIDKWERWDRSIESLIAQVDVAYLDGTFFADGELASRSMSEVPHPFIEESMRRFESLPPAERSKIRFIHLNHTNPALQPGCAARRQIEAAGFGVAVTGERVGL